MGSAIKVFLIRSPGPFHHNANQKYASSDDEPNFKIDWIGLSASKFIQVV